ncbi:DUF6252 family protein [Formosa sp. S-31]|uniref:DUF6252 family protein n=1 Tax=Formosa sp. S-31 TaxID=2790949 RepID=UPI003EB8A8CE
MKLKLSLFLVVVFFVGCGDQLEFNNPALEARKDDVLWKSESREAITGTNILTIKGYLENETITLKILVPYEGVYPLGVESTTVAYFNDGETEYSTAFNPVDDPETEENESLIYPAEGEIVIDEINSLQGYVSGSFWFRAYDNLGEQAVNFSQGVFYEVSTLIDE